MAVAIRTNATMSPPSRTNRASLDTLYRRLKKENSDVLEKELRRIDALLSLHRVEGTVEENAITMNEIVEEVNDVRAERYAREASSI